MIFARAARLGTVKRRLAAQAGPVAALRFHRGQVARLARLMRGERRWRTVFAVTPDRGFLPVPFARVPQGRGDLGARMWRAMAPHRRVVLVGCDIPGLGRAEVAAAFRALGKAQAVFGPAEDGGFYLVGFGPRRPPAPFRGVTWSAPTTLAETVARCQPHRVAFVRTLRDVDSVDDLRATTRR